MLNAPGGFLCGFRGDRAPVLEEEFGARLGGKETSPVTLLLIGGRMTLLGLSVVSASFSSGRAPRTGEPSVPIACRRAFSCFAWMERKCASNSCHLISSLPILERPARVPVVLYLKREDPSAIHNFCKHLHLGRNLQESCRIDCVKTVAQRDESRTLRQQHQYTVQAFEKIRVFFRFQKLKSNVFIGDEVKS